MTVNIIGCAHGGTRTRMWFHSSGTRHVSDDELDCALEHGKLALGKPNARIARCCRASCRRLVPEGSARRLVIDGIVRGYLCLTDCWDL